MLKNTVLLSVSEVECCGKPSHIQFSPLYLKYSLSTLDINSRDKIHNPMILRVGQRSHNRRTHAGKSLGMKLCMDTNSGVQGCSQHEAEEA